MSFKKNDRVAFPCGDETCFGRVYNVQGHVIYVISLPGEIIVKRDSSGIRRMTFFEIVKYDWYGGLVPKKI